MDERDWKAFVAESERQKAELAKTLRARRNRKIWKTFLIDLCEPQTHELARGVPVGVGIALFILCLIIT